MIEKWTSFDDVVYCEYIETSQGGYNLIQQYVGAINENEEEDIETAIGCDIEVCESTSCKDYEHKIIDALYSVLESEGESPEYWEDVSMICAPRIHKNISVWNECDYNDTQRIVERIKDFLKAV